MQKVLIGVSGGVDSSVACHLLKEEGYEVIGAHFSLRDNLFDNSDAKAVCDALNIELITVDFSEIFEKSVFSEFIKDYASGITPNICVRCNQKIKFGALIELANSLGIDKIATGHYCKIENVDGKTKLVCPKDSQKDQTYFLNQVPESVLSKVIFPLSDLTKEEVRRIAEENHLITASKKDSSDICIMQNQSLKTFLSQYIKANKGKIIDSSGNVVGEHDGLFNYTLGQRKGLGLGGKTGESGRWFVVNKDRKTNALIVSHGSEDALYEKELSVYDCNYIGFSPTSNFRCLAKTRYRQNAQPCAVYVDGDKAKVVFDEPQRAITSGQYCVFYLDGYLIGGGRIY